MMYITKIDNNICFTIFFRSFICFTILKYTCTRESVCIDSDILLKKIR